MCQVDGGEFILEPGTRKGMLYPEGREPVPMLQEADLVGARKTAPPPVFRSEPLYQVRYPGPQFYSVSRWKFRNSTSYSGA